MTKNIIEKALGGMGASKLNPEGEPQLDPELADQKAEIFDGVRTGETPAQKAIEQNTLLNRGGPKPS